jgi:hypothetical protein
MKAIERSREIKEDLDKKMEEGAVIDLELTYKIFKERTPKYDKAMKTMFKLQSGGFKSPNNMFEPRYGTMIQTQLHKTKIHSDRCDIHKGVLCETSHILFSCKDASSQQIILLKDVNEIIKEEMVDVPLGKRGPNNEVVAWWQNDPTNFHAEEKIVAIIVEEDLNIEEVEQIVDNIGLEKEEESENEEDEKEMDRGDSEIESDKEEEKGDLENEKEEEKGEKRTMRQMKLWETEKTREKKEEIKKKLIEKQKIGNDNLKRKREEAELKRKEVKRRRKLRFTDKELGCKGYINKTLKTQIELITEGNKKLTEKISCRILIRFMKYIEEMYRLFWERQNENLRKEGIKDNKSTVEKRDTGEP